MELWKAVNTTECKQLSDLIDKLPKDLFGVTGWKHINNYIRAFCVEVVEKKRTTHIRKNSLKDLENHFQRKPTLEDIRKRLSIYGKLDSKIYVIIKNDINKLA